MKISKNHNILHIIIILVEVKLSSTLVEKKHQTINLERRIIKL